MENDDLKLALMTAKRAMKIVFFIGVILAILMMINIYILLTQITATAEIDRKVKTLELVITQNTNKKGDT